jgi:SAM-dependent methyltransferase
MDEVRRKLRSFSDAAASEGKFLDWFERLYEHADNNPNWIPWSKGQPHPLLVDWMKDTDQTAGTALVVGCGLGEDALFLAELGWNVTAFDIAPTAVEWASKRYPHDNIRWVVGDLLQPDKEWFKAFDLVLEVHILQAIPKEFRIPASRNLSPLVSPSGQLVCIGRLSVDDSVEHNGPPWPLSKEFISSVGNNLKSIDFTPAQFEGEESVRYRAVWTNE